MKTRYHGPSEWERAKRLLHCRYIYRDAHGVLHAATIWMAPR